MSFGSSGVGSSTHLALELFKSLAGVKITHIPYTGSPQVVTDLLADRIQGYFSPASTVSGHVRAGKLVALAVTDAKRSTFFPNLPTMIEAGVPDCESVLWFGIAAPAGTPQPIIDKLSRAANEALKSDDVIKSLHAQTVAAHRRHAGGLPPPHGSRAQALDRRRRGGGPAEVARRQRGAEIQTAIAPSMRSIRSAASSPPRHRRSAAPDWRTSARPRIEEHLDDLPPAHAVPRPRRSPACGTCWSCSP